MRDKRYSLRSILLFVFALFSFSSFSQTLPGKIIRAATLGASNTILDPVAPTGWTSKTTSGFLGNDVGNAKLGFKAIPTFSTEPFGDLRRGANHLYTDFVPDAAGNGVYLYFDGTNLLFRMRLGTIVPGAKGYSILIDTDLKFGNSGANADPNYLPATTGVNGNPGFEREIILATGGTNNGILVYDIDNSDNPSALTPIATYSGWTNYSQISIAGTNDNGDPDFFVDFYVPLSALGGGITASTPLRFGATTVMSGQAAIGGPKSDIYGLNDNSYKSTNAEWEAYINQQQPITPSSLSGTGTLPTGTAACTAAPTITSVTTSGGANGKGVISGKWTKLSTSTQTSATITVYQNGTQLTGAVNATSGGTWTFDIPSGITLLNGQAITAKALASNEASCLSSNNYTVAGCGNWAGAGLIAPLGSASPNNYACLVSPTANTTNKGVGATNRTSSAWTVYVNEAVNNLNENSTANQGTAKFANNGGSTFSASATGNWLYSDGCQGGSNLSSGVYTFWYQDANGCKSDVTPICVSGNGNGGTLAGTITPAPTISPSTVTPATTSVTVTGAAGTTIALYYNGEVVGTATVSGTYNGSTTGTVTFSNLVFGAGGVVSAFSQKIVSGSLSTSYCPAKSAIQTIPLCATTTPVINADANGQITAGQPITGYSSEPSGTTVKVYTSGNTLVATVTTAADGSWTTSSSYNAAATTTYYATAQNGTCALSAQSGTATAATATTNVCGNITSTVDETSTTVSGSLSTTPASNTTVSLYQDGVFVASTTTATASWTITGIAAGTFNPNSTLSISIRQGSNQEVFCQNTKPVVCASPAGAATIVSPTNPTVVQNATITYTLSGIAGGNFYGIVDANSGKTLSAGQWATSNSNLTITTYPFTAASGTVYNIQVKSSSVSPTAVCTSIATGNVTISGVLPVNFLSVAATKNATGVQVNWDVTNEQTVLYYMIERSTDCNSYEVIGRVDYKPPVGGNNHYSLQDLTVPSGRVCYRIKQVDANSRVQYSSIVSVNTANSMNVQLMPNPAVGNTTVIIFASAEAIATVFVIDANGQVVLRQTSPLQKGSNAIGLNGLQKFARGNYIVQIATAEGISHQRLLLQ